MRYLLHRLPCLVLLAALFLLCPSLTVAQIDVSKLSRNLPNSSDNTYNNNYNDPDSSQNKEPEGIIYEVASESDSMLSAMVNNFMPAFRAVKVYEVQHPLISPHGVEFFNPVHGIDGFFYADRGALGQAHTDLAPFALETMRLLSFHEPSCPLAFTLQTDPFPVFRQRLHRFSMFQTHKPYTMLRYGSSLNKDYQIGVVHTQNIKPRWNFALRYDLTSRDGVYTNDGGTNHIVDLTTNYYSSDARYQLQAALSFNRMRQEENGGLLDDTTWMSGARRQGIPVNMYYAQNQWRDLVLDLHQSLNTVRQFQQVRPRIVSVVDSSGAYDSIAGYDTLLPRAPHSYNSGVFGFDLHLARHRRIFSDIQPDSWFYTFANLDTSVYYDSTTHYQLSADLYWTNDAYMNHRWHNPFVLLFGIRPELNNISYVAGKKSFFSVTPFAQASLDVGRFSLLARGEEVTGGERNGDYRLQANIELRLGRFSVMNLAALSQALSPDWLYYYNVGCYAWDNSDFRKVKRQQLAFAYSMNKPDSVGGHLRILQTRASASLVSDNIWLDASMQPSQGDASAMLLQTQALAQLRFGWFNIRTQQMLQYSSDDNVVRAPLFASKNSFYADFTLFRNTLRMQAGFDLRYHSPFKADAWNPILAAWYRQDDVKVGGYLVADFWLTLQIKRASIYLKASHFNAAIEDLAGLTPNYFSLPHYPMEDFGLYWGVIWKFFD